MAIDFDINIEPSVEEDIYSQNTFNDSENIVMNTNNLEVTEQPTTNHHVDPEEGMCFGTLEEARDYYQRYAETVGFVVKIRNTNWETKNGDRVPINQSLHCNKDGYRVSRVKAPKRRKTVASAGCGARCHISFDKTAACWKISRLELSHSHPLKPKLSRIFPAYRELSMHAMDIIEQNEQVGIRPSKTYQALADQAGGPSNLTFTEWDVRNYISRNLRVAGDENDSKELLMYFSRLKEINPNFFYKIDVDENQSIKNVFWADARCRASWEYFGDVVSFDTTYKTNRYEMPFASFVGVNHHGMSKLLGCALLKNEESKTFEWLLQTLLNCMGSAPACIITDQCIQVRYALAATFPSTRHQWCIWHILKKIPQKLLGYKHYQEISSCMKKIVWESRSEESFNEDWKNFIHQHNLHECRWLNSILGTHSFF